jgi:molybdopterin molybdotransferase
LLSLLPSGEPAMGRDVRQVGEEVRAGEVILRAGQVMTPPALGLAAAAGIDSLPVLPAPTTSILILGDELRTSGVPEIGQVRDSLQPQLPGWVEAMHASVHEVTRVADDLDLTIAALRSAAGEIILTTGGTAGGPADHMSAAIEALAGTWLVNGVAVRPGHPMKLASLPDGRHLVAMPGNPLAAISALVTLGAPLLQGLSGRTDRGSDAAGSSLIRRPVAEPIERSPGAHRLIPASLENGVVRPTLRRGPAMLSGLAIADVLIVVPPGATSLAAGVAAEVLPLPWGTGLVV